MVTRLDSYVGRIVDLIKELGLDEHTIFVFSSDNGPLDDRFGGTDTDFFNSAGGPAAASRARSTKEACAMPTFVRWKGKIEPRHDQLPRHRLRRLAADAARTRRLRKRFPQGLDGISFTADARRAESMTPRPFLYREFPGYGGQQSVRVGEWKGIRQNYYLCFGSFLDGDYRSRAAGVSRGGPQGGYNSTEGRWIDSICYHAMMGECCYQMGEICRRPRPVRERR